MKAHKKYLYQLNILINLYVYSYIHLQTLDLQRSSLNQGLYDKISKFMPIMKV